MLAISTSSASGQITVPAGGVISTVAGAGLYAGDSGAATSARLNAPVGMGIDSSGNLYFADVVNNCVRKVTASTGTISTVSGGPAGGYGGDGGSAKQAKLQQPQGVAVDSSGNLYVADAGNNRIRKIIAATGVITTIAGNGTAGYSGDGSSAINAELDSPTGVALDSAGSVYIADANNNVVRKVSVSTGYISTIAGNGTFGFAGDGGAAISAELASPASVALDSSGNLYIADLVYSRIREVIVSTGVIQTVAGTAGAGYNGDNISATSADLNSPEYVWVDSSKNIYIADSGNNRIRKVTASSGLISTIAGTGLGAFSGDGGQATNAGLNYPSGVLLDASSNVYIADSTNNRVRKVTASGVINTFAGSTSYSGNGGAATAAVIAYPAGVRLDASGNLYIADTTNQVIRKVLATTGVVSTVAGNGTAGYSGDGGAATSAKLNSPEDLAIDSTGNLYIADTQNSCIRKVNVTVSPATITTVAGKCGIATPNNNNQTGDNGPATSGTLWFPSGVALDSAGNLYIADYHNGVVRKVSNATGATPGNITKFAGTYNTCSFSGDGGPAVSAVLCSPYSVAVDSTNNLYISDVSNSDVREVLASNGNIQSVAGTAQVVGFSGDGGPATSAILNLPEGITVDKSGNLYISDNGNNNIRKVTLSNGYISTVAGSGVAGFSGDGAAAMGAEFFWPAGMAVDSSGNLYVADTNNNRIRAVGKPKTMTPTLTWAAPASIGYGTALSATQLNASASIPGTFAYTPAAGQILPLGSNTLSVTFTPTDSSDFTTATATTSLSVIQGVPKITWATPAAITAGTALSATQLNATANTAGTFTYSPPSGTVLAQGTQTLTAQFTPSNTSEFASGTASVLLTVNASTTAGIIHTIAGTGNAGYNGDSVAATSAELNQPYDSVADSSGNLYISDNSNFRIRKVAAGTGVITTYAGNGVNVSGSCSGGYCAEGVAGNGGPATAIELGYVAGLAVDTSGNLYYADTNLNVVRKITASNGTINTVAGNGYQSEYTGDGGAATSATLNAPLGVAVDASGNLYISDSSNYVIRKVAASTGKISTIAGTGMVAGYSGDGGAATSAKLDYPTGIAVDGSGNVYISDESSDVVRKVTASTGIITTYAGNGTAGFSGDNGPATGAELSSPQGISIDSAENLFIADSANVRVREVSAASGLIATVAGTGVYGYNGDGIPATTAELKYPTSARVAANGNLYIADFGDSRVRMVGASTQVPNLTWLTPAPIYFGTALSAVQLDASSNGVPGTITYSEAVGTVLKAGTYTLSAEFVPSSSAYSTETAQVTLTVNPAPAPVSWPQPADIVSGTALSATQLDATSTVPGTFAYSPGSGTVLGIGPQLLNVTFSPTDSIDYVSTTATVAITVTAGSTTYDAGTVAFVANTTTLATVSYGQSSTGASVASALATAVNGVASTPVKLIAVDNDLYLTAVTPGTTGDSVTYAIENTAYNSSAFSGPSFPVSTLSGTLEGGAASGSDGGKQIYGYNNSYDHVGNLTASSNDPVMGNWSFSPDTLNRLAGGSNVPVPVATSPTAYYCWSYDSFGNRSVQGQSTKAFASPAPACTPQSNASYQGVWAHLSAGNNRLSSTQQALGGVGYDAAGNIVNDGVNQYLYDGEGRVCAVSYGSTGQPILTGYIYNAAGERVSKGSITAWSCDPTVNGFKPMSDYIVGQSGEQMTEMDINTSGSMTWQHTNVFALGKLIATYDNDGLHFYLNDALGTRRAQTDYAGVVEQTCLSLPFGDALNCTNNLQFPTEHHFTGKERDAESGLDNFGPRYYASTTGRFTSPDEFGGHLEDPQTLNKYSYVGNNPLSRTDPTGHDFWQSCDKASSTCQNQQIGTNKDGSAINHLVQGTTDSNGKFSATVITSASLSQAGSGNTATVNGNGVSITSSTGTAQGIFINGTQSADIQGSGAGWNQFSFHIDSNDAAHGVLTAGTATYQGEGGWHGMVNAIEAMKWNGHGPFVYSEESTRYGNPFHPGALNYRFSSGDHPELFNYGPSPHFAVTPNVVPQSDFHVDSETGPMHGPCAVAGVGCY